MRRSKIEAVTFSLDTVTSLISDVTDRNIAVHEDYERLHDADGPPGNLTSSDPRGTSGGPVFGLRDTTNAHALEIVGFLYQQSELTQAVLARHADMIRTASTIR